MADAAQALGWTAEVLDALARIESRLDSLAGELERYRYLLPEPGSIEAKAASWKARRATRRGATNPDA